MKKDPPERAFSSFYFYFIGRRELVGQVFNGHLT